MRARQSSYECFFRMTVLSSNLRKTLEDTCVRGRRAADIACRASLVSLGVTEKTVPGHLDEDDRILRRGLRAKSRQLGDEEDSVELLVAECAFEQWHRLLFARFLAENGLLIHPKFRAPMTLTECEELASELGEPDGWAVAGRFAAEILPGIFRLNDPCVQLRLAPEGRLELEQIVSGLPSEVFLADDALGWVYQFWQKDKKDEVNASERKIGGADLGPVTQLFTEHYMVRFLLENSLGAWWASRYPESPLVKEWEFLRFNDEGAPAAGSFDGWPERAAEVTVVDPCCGSGHFLVEAFGMLWRMRAEEEQRSSVTAQDAVLRDNLFGLELDPRCVQIAMFAVALSAWKAGEGWRELPAPNISCSGIPVKAPVEEWKALARGDATLDKALVRLHTLFRDADTLGSLIDPRRTAELANPAAPQGSFDDVEWDDVAPLIAIALTRETDDPATQVLGANVAGIARAADYLSRRYTLVATNVPYLSKNSQGPILRNFCERNFAFGSNDLATVFLLRLILLSVSQGSVALVLPQHWLYLSSYEKLRRESLRSSTWDFVARLGVGAFEGISGEVVNVCLFLSQTTPPKSSHFVSALDLNGVSGASAKSRSLRSDRVLRVEQRTLLANPHARMSSESQRGRRLLREFAVGRQGIKTGDDGRYRRRFWEVPHGQPGWEFFQSTVAETLTYGGRQDIVFWEDGCGAMAGSDGSRIVGREAWGRSGVMVSQMGNLPVSLYSGDLFDTNASPLIPINSSDLSAIWHFCSSPEYATQVRAIDSSMKVTNRTLADVPFDIDHWRGFAKESGPLPEPWSDDPTQWLFEGSPGVAAEPLQVAVGRLLGYHWPQQLEADDLDFLADNDGIACLPSVRGERPAADLLQELLARALGGTWSPARAAELLAMSGSNKTDLESWLRDDFFKVHCQVFKNRPFVWQIWDGRRDGFSALLNYHRLDRRTIERLNYTYLGDWIERQAAGAREDVAGAADRLAAAQNLQHQLQLIIEGEAPFDIYVRWKSLAEQPIGWEPDLNDGVRLNIRPFVEAGILRTKFNVKWDKDRGKNLDGTERFNDLHFTLAEKTEAEKGLAR